MAKKKRVGRPILNEKYNVPKGKKICGKCLVVKSTSEFHKHKRLKDGLQPQCKQCGKKAVYKHRAENREHYRQKDREKYAKDPEREKKRQRDWRDKKLSGPNAKEFKARVKEINRRSALKREYDLTLEQYDQMLKDQNGQCALCGATKGGKTGGKDNLHVDHNHDTGEVRALLCIQCNRGLGCFGDNPKQLIQAALYLLEYDNGPSRIQRTLTNLLN